MSFGYIDPTISCETGYIYSWSLCNYKTAVAENEEDAYAELERSIVAKLADDIVVGVRGNNVEIIKQTITVIAATRIELSITLENIFYLLIISIALSVHVKQGSHCTIQSCASVS